MSISKTSRLCQHSTITTLDDEVIEVTRIGNDLYIDNERITQVSITATKAVELRISCVMSFLISGAQYWHIVHGDAAPDIQYAGLLEAQLAEIRWSADRRIC